MTSFQLHPFDKIDCKPWKHNINIRKKEKNSSYLIYSIDSLSNHRWLQKFSWKISFIEIFVNYLENSDIEWLLPALCGY